MARVLVIDDDEDLRELIESVLTAQGFEVALASDGQRGLAAQRKRPADVVITDIFMPEKDGLETIVALRREFPGQKIIAISGGAGSSLELDYLATARQIGGVKTVAKPFTSDELIQAVRDLLA